MDVLSLFIAGIRWQDIVDILLNGYILFRLYVLFRGTYVLRMLIGVVLLWFFQRMSVAAGLIVTSWAIQGITAVAALIIIVVFGREIRSVFQAKSLRSLLWGIPTKAFSGSIETIAESVFEMAGKHCGALLVIPGKKNLRGIIENGISWRGLISREMILSIFWHNNPVHDGAVIIQGDQISDVGTILPLSRRQDLPKYYGTRHRAAIGLSEVSDAMVIVVSEERGVVVAVKDGAVQVMHNRYQLEEALRAHMGVTVKRKNSIGGERLGLGGAAAACLVIVVAIWFVLARGLNALITLETPLEYVDLPVNMEILSTSVPNIRLHLSGSQLLVKSIQPGQVRARINLREATVGYNSFPINTDNILLPPGIILARVEPRVVEMDIDAHITETFPAQVNWVGKLREDIVISDVRIKPETVKLIGSTRTLRQLQTVYTRKVPVEDIEESGALTVDLDIAAGPIAVAPDSTAKIRVTYTVNPRQDKDLPATE